MFTASALMVQSFVHGQIVHKGEEVGRLVNTALKGSSAAFTAILSARLQ